MTPRTIESADGCSTSPRRGRHGGQDRRRRHADKLRADPKSPTGPSSRQGFIAVPATRRRPEAAGSRQGAKENNLKASTPLPLRRFVPGHRRLGRGNRFAHHQILHPALRNTLHDSQWQWATQDHHGVRADRQGHRHRPEPDRAHAALEPGDVYQGVRAVRKLFAARRRRALRLRQSRFSFNVPGALRGVRGRRMREVEMHFLANVQSLRGMYGKRFKRRDAARAFKGKNISEVAVDDGIGRARAVRNQPSIIHILRTLDDVGLGYLQLGHAATTLSGGEAQRIKLSRELARSSTRAHLVHPRRADHGFCTSATFSASWTCSIGWWRRATRSGDSSTTSTSSSAPTG